MTAFILYPGLSVEKIENSSKVKKQKANAFVVHKAGPFTFAPFGE
jgi:hypothetical protein